jgi:photosystem II oxygen-evolving enhancer protein 2
MAAITSAASTVVARPAFVGKTESLRVRAVAPAAPKRASVVTLASAEETSRRAALSTFTVSADVQRWTHPRSDPGFECERGFSTI